MKKILYGFCFLSILVLIGACFSPWRGEENGNLSIVWGNTENSARLIHDLTDPELTGYKVFLKGPDGKQQEYDFSGVPGASFSVAPGTWNVIVKGGMVSTNTAEEIFSLSILGMSQIEVRAGENTTENIDMYNALEVWSWDDLTTFLNIYDFGYCDDPACDILWHEVIMVLKSEDPLGCEYDVNETLNIFYGPVIIVADSDITIIRGNNALGPFRDQFFYTNGPDARLTLGLPGMNGRITIDGYLEDLDIFYEPTVVPTKEAITVGYGSTLVMNEGVTITGNFTDDSTNHYGGGVYVLSATFNMNGGTISGNKADSSAGGVFIDDEGTFNMTGGTISGNKAMFGNGGGVCVNVGGFNMTGGTISGNEAVNGDGGGVSVQFGSFDMTGGTISGNKAYNGGGVYVSGGYSDFTKTGNSVIYGSNAPSETLKNTAFDMNTGEDGFGHAVYVYSSSTGSGGDTNPPRIRNTTAGAGVDLNTEISSGWD